MTVTQYLDEYRGPVAAGLRVPGFGADALSGRRWCSPGQSPSIGPDGSVFPCLPFTRTPFLMGRMPKDTLEQAFHSKVVQDLRRKCQERIDEIEECSSCVWKHFCRAGCPGIAYHQHGSVTAKDCFCELRKRLYTDLFLGGQDNGDRRPE
ncbi:SPASM domain-containing protein [bacterium]|nr:SPASM domain-containing protein [bacterium]